MKKTLCLLLAALLTLPLVSCVNDTPEAGTAAPDTDQTVTNTAEPETAEEETAETIPPLPTADMDGFTLRISNIDPAALSWANITIVAEEQDGTPVNDAIYQRNLELEETYNCKIEQTLQASFGDVAYINNMVAAGSDEYDLCMVYDIKAAEVVGAMLDWNQLPHLDLSQTWWNPDATSLFAIQGKQHYTAGNSTMGYLSRAMCYLVNWTLYENIGFSEDLYQLVKDGKWTQDIFYSVAAQAVMDTNGDGVYNAEDTYGVFGNPRGFLNALMGGANIRYVEADEEGNFLFRMAENETAINLLITAVQFMTANPNIYYNEGSVPSDLKPDTLFAAGQALFHLQGMPHTISLLREMEDDFGIVPLPKLDEAQQKYYAPSYGAVLTGIPKTVASDRYEYLGLLMEAMTRRSQELVVPQYKEVLMKDKLARDEESSEMLDIIFTSITFDAGVVLWCSNLSDKICSDIFMKKNDAIVSYLERATPVFQKLIDSFNEALT